MKRFTKFGVVLLCATCVLLPAIAADEAREGERKGGPEGDEMAAMMAEMMKYSMPGEHHQHLRPLAGTWKLSSRFRQDPEAPWSESTGESTSEWILGGRFLQQKVKSPPSEAMPMPFEGFGLLGYDMLAKKYLAIWTDTFLTGAMVFHGTCDDSGKVITLSGEFDNPMKGGARTKETWVYKIINNDKFVFQMWGPSDSGKDYLHGEITYTRVK